MLFGRGRELNAVAGLMALARRGQASAVVLRGDPGIGKSALLADAIGKAESGGWTVLQCTGVASEHDLERAALVSLCRPVADRADDPTPEHGQVMRAMLAGEPVTPLGAGVAVLHLLSLLAAERPVLVVIDDAQWVDAATLAAVRFALHRLREERVAVLVADRTDERADLPGFAVLEVGALDADASRRVLGSVAELAVPVATGCQERCGGNPLALIELARSLSASQRAGRSPLPEHLQLSEGLRAGLEQSLVALPERTRRALVVVTHGGRLRPAQLAAALAAVGLTRADLEPAEAAGVLRRTYDGLAFRHPLLGEAAAIAAPALVTDAHRAVAGVVDGDRRAWHLAKAGEDAAAEAIEELSRVAERAAERGAMGAAAAAWERAASLTTDDAARLRLLLAAGTALAGTANPAYAIPVLEAALEHAADDVDRARVVLVLGTMLCWHVSVDRGVAMMSEAAEAARPHDVALPALLLASAGNFVALGGDLARAVDLGRQAEALAGAAEPVTQVAVRLISTHLRVIHGTASSLAEVDAERRGDFDVLTSLVVAGAPAELLDIAEVVAFDLIALERWGDALDLLERIVAVARPRGLVGSSMFALAMRSEVLFRLGRWSEARAESVVHLDHHLRLEEPTASFGHATLARLEAVLGLGGAAAAHAATAADHGDSVGMGVLAAWGWHAQGLLALAERRPHDAIEPLSKVWRLCRQGEIDNPGPLWWQGDLLEAFLGAGEHLEARRLRRWLADRADVTGNRWAAAVVARADALLDHDLDQAERSVRLLDELGTPFEAARSRLALAACLRSHPDRAGARGEVLEQALDVFERLGAVSWAREARAELGGAGERPPRLAVPLAAALSEAELRVALSVGRGLTNREAAAELALSPKTIDAHLQSIYRKLNVRSRAALAYVVARERTWT
jgi:DNA-binding CsgD family transcriptional regulator